MPALRQHIETIAARGRVEAGDVPALRKLVFGDGAVTAPEIEALVSLDERLKPVDAAWTEMIVEAVCDYLVHQVEPEGYVDDNNARWLQHVLARDGAIRHATELEILIRVIEKAASVPPSLAAFALAQVKDAVLTGKGPLARGGELVPGRVGAPEVALLRRILHAAGGDGGIAVSRAEAETLFEIDQATAGAENDPAWCDLFVKAIANFMMAASGYQAPSRDEALARSRWLDSPTEGVGGLFARMAQGGLSGLMRGLMAPGTEDLARERNRVEAERIREAEMVTDGEARWLAERIGRDGRMSPNESALLKAVARDGGGALHPLLRPLVDRAA